MTWTSLARQLVATCVMTGVLAIAGCDFLSPGGPSFSGVVVDAVTEEPIEGIQMSLKISGGGFGSSTIVASVLTDADGKFWLRDPKDRAGRPGLYVNSPGYTGDQPSPYNPLYTGGLADYDFDDRHDIRVELRQLPN